MKREKDRLLISINRYDHYFESVNNKTAVYIAINTFILTATISGYYAIEESIVCLSNLFNIVVVILLAIGIISLAILIIASIPYFSKHSESLYYFGGVSSKTINEFIECSSKMSKKEELDDLRNQTHTLSKGLRTKFIRLKLSGWLLFTQSMILIPIITIILINKL